MKDPELKTRDHLLQIIQERRGVHKSELCRLAGRGWGTVGHHLYNLQKAGLVETQVNGRLLWIFDVDTPLAQRQWLIHTHTPGRRRILEILGIRPNVTIDELSDELAMSKRVIRNHLGQIRRADINRGGPDQSTLRGKVQAESIELPSVGNERP